MDITFSVPDKVASVFATEQDIQDFAIGKLTEYARDVTVQLAAEEANAIIAVAQAQFDDVETTPTKTLPEQLKEDATLLRGQVRSIGVGLAIAVGATEEQATGIIDAALAQKPV